MRPDLDILYRENARRLAALAYQMTGDHALADDVVQETFVAAHRAISSFRGDAEPATWLYRIAIRTAVRLRERARRERPATTADIAGTTDRPGDGSSDHRLNPQSERAESIEELRLGLDALSEEHRIVLSLVNLRDLAVAQVAAVLDIPEGTVWSRASVARRRLRESIEARRNAADRDVAAPPQSQAQSLSTTAPRRRRHTG